MIIENGTIEFKTKGAAGQIDAESGYPTAAAEVEWSKPIPCQFTPNNRNNLGRVNGEHFTTASYTVLLEEQPLPDSEQIRLKDRNGTELGEFSLIAPPEPLDAVCEIKLLV
jgi:hypothetical protein